MEGREEDAAAPSALNGTTRQRGGRREAEGRARLAEVARGPGLDEGHVGGETDAVDMPPGVEVVQAIQHDAELAEERYVVLGLLDVRAVRHDLGVRAEAQDGLAGHLRREEGDRVALFCKIEVSLPVTNTFLKSQTLTRLCLGVPDVPATEEELAVQVARFYGVHINLAARRASVEHCSGP